MDPLGVNMKRNTLPPPLLQPALTPGTAGAAAVNTCIPRIRMGYGMLRLPTDVRALPSGDVGDTIRPEAGMETRGDASPKVGQGTIPHVNPNEMGLPKFDHMGTMLEKRKAPGVLDMSVHASGGGKVRLLIESPLFLGEPSALSFFKGQVGLYPGHIMEFMTV